MTDLCIVLASPHLQYTRTLQSFRNILKRALPSVFVIYIVLFFPKAVALIAQIYNQTNFIFQIRL